MGKLGKGIVIALVVVVVAFFTASFFIDRAELEDTFARSEASYPQLTPTYEAFASGHPRAPADFTMNGKTLRGYVYEAASPKGLVVFRHGIGSNHTAYLALITALVDRGWSVYAYDAIGSGESDGDHLIGMAQSALDVSAAVNFVRESGIAGDLPVALWGHSWGGYGVAAAMDIVPDVAACVTMSGYNVPAEVLFEFCERSMGPIGVTQRPTLWLNNKLAFGADADRSALDGINKTNAPVLIIHGSGDAVVSYTGSGIIAQRDRITNPNVEYLVFDQEGRDGHNSYFYDSDANAYLAEARADWNALLERFPDGVPDAETQAFMAGYDVRRGNVAASDLIDAIDGFLSRAVGANSTQGSTSSGSASSASSASSGAAPGDGQAYGDLEIVRFSDSGNSLGNLYMVEAERNAEGMLVVTVRESPSHDQDTVVHEYRAPDDLLTRISALVDETGMKTWGDLPLSEFVPLDAAIPTLSLTYASADPADSFPIWLSTSFAYELPEGGKDAVWSVRDLMLSCATEENLIGERTEAIRN